MHVCVHVRTLQWSAPEVCEGNAIKGVVASVMSDVYMVGGLMYELLTGGTAPFHWLTGDPHLLVLRRQSAGMVAEGVPSLRGKSVLEAAAIDRQEIPWRVRASSLPGSAARLETVKSMLADCLALEPSARPKLPDLLERVDALLAADQRERAAAVGAASIVRRGSCARDTVAQPPPRLLSVVSP
jgi:hypothetical protein